MKLRHVIFPTFFLSHLTFSKKQRIDDVYAPKTFYGIDTISNSKRPRTSNDWATWKKDNPDSEYVEFFFVCNAEKLKDECESAASTFKKVSIKSEFVGKLNFLAVDASAKFARMFTESIGLTKEAVEKYPIFTAISAPFPEFDESGKLQEEVTFNKKMKVFKANDLAFNEANILELARGIVAGTQDFIEAEHPGKKSWKRAKERSGEL